MDKVRTTNKLRSATLPVAWSLLLFQCFKVLPQPLDQRVTFGSKAVKSVAGSALAEHEKRSRPSVEFKAGKDL